MWDVIGLQDFPIKIIKDCQRQFPKVNYLCVAWVEWRSVPEFHFIGILIRTRPAIPLWPGQLSEKSQAPPWAPKEHSGLLFSQEDLDPSSQWVQGWELKCPSQNEKKKSYTLSTKKEEWVRSCVERLGRTAPLSPRRWRRAFDSWLYLTKTSLNYLNQKWNVLSGKHNWKFWGWQDPRPQTMSTHWWETVLSFPLPSVCVCVLPFSLSLYLSLYCWSLLLNRVSAMWPSRRHQATLIVNFPYWATSV